jgi:FkbM family methyltransferase
LDTPPRSTQRYRVVFATPYAERAEFLIELDRRRHTEDQIAASLLTGALYEQCTSWVMAGLLRPGDFAVDIGAHVGYYTLLMRTLVGAEGLVCAAEPLPESHAALLANVALNGHVNVECMDRPLADRSGRARLLPDPRNEGESRLAADAEGSAGLEVDTTTLDHWLLARQRAPRLVKIDAEGCELRILDGGSRLFRELAPDAVICEINPPALRRFGASPRLLRERLASLGYVGYLINPALAGPFDLCDGAILAPWPKDREVGVNVVHNLLYCRPGVVPVGLGI